jgi:hypothetical protein
VSDDVLFASGSAKLDAIGRDVLVKVAEQIKQLEDYVEVRGHTDDRRIRGTLAKRFPTNWELAAARASRVVRLLESQGVAGDRLAAVSLAANEPVAPNDTSANRALNRRIEIRLLPKEGSIRAGTEAGAAPATPGSVDAAPPGASPATPTPAARVRLEPTAAAFEAPPAPKPTPRAVEEPTAPLESTRQN